MKEKEKMIIYSALKLFAQKGYSSTSIQEIANDCGISKGAFYLYFKSKDSLLFAILHYYYDEIISMFESISQKDISDRDKFVQQTTYLFDNALKHKDFIIMQAREQAIPLNESIRALMLQMQSDLHQYSLRCLYSIYGEKYKDFVFDLLIMYEGFTHSFLKLLILDKNEIDTKNVAEYLLRRMDSIVKEINQEVPLLTENYLQRLLIKPKINFMVKDTKIILEILEQIRVVIEDYPNKEELEVTLEVLQAEINKDHPRIPIIQGMLSNLSEYDQLKKYQKEIASFYQLSQF
ncbi:TetR/AcrR family transcriptional regulator [Niallia sp. 03133]|uniref:TetR/AcrR family transcriptional regulator n=1 Tax=Niallia sp. 03133 TaxID=3458060 RepID=UPI0040443805